MMKLPTAYCRLAIIISTMALNHISSCMNVMVCFAKAQKDSTEEQGKLHINIDPHTDTESSIIAKIITQYTQQHKTDADITPFVLKITQANRTRTPLAQLIEEGLDIHKQLILRALIQVH